MLYPGIKLLGDADLAKINAATAATVITSAADAQGSVQAYIDRLEGMVAATISANFVWGGGAGANLKAIIETTLNQGVTWIEVARLAFATSSAEKLLNLSALTPKSPLTPGALSDDTSLDGILGDRFRSRILTTGTYSGNTSLSIRLHAK